MIAHQLGMRAGQLMSARIGRARLSYERLDDTLAGHLAGVAMLHGSDRLQLRPPPHLEE